MPMQTKAYIFDVDGTLTDSRQTIDPKFKEFFLKFIENNNVYLVTGSDYPKTVEQLGDEILHKVNRSYNCAGNSIWEKGVEVSTSDWQLSNEARDWLLRELYRSKFPLRTGTHIEDRPGMVNFSIVGRGAGSEARQSYIDYDKSNKERKSIADSFNKRFKKENIIAQVAGETGLDIIEIGKDKQQVLDDFAEHDIMFLGDMMQVGGNDAPLAKAIKERNNPNDKCIWVKGYTHTWSVLKDIT